MHPCQIRAVSGHNQLLPWQLCILYLLCWLYHIQRGHGLLVELQQSLHLNHWWDHEWGRMFWNLLDLKQTITLPDQSTSVCRNDVVRIQIYVSGDAIQLFHNFRSLLRGVHGKIWSSASSCVHSSNLSTPTNPLTKLTHIASFSLCEPPKNNVLSNCSLLILSSTHFVKSCCSAVLFFDTDQNQSISTGRGWSKPEIIVSMLSPVVLRLRSLSLMVLSLYTSKAIFTWLHDLKRKLNVLQRLTKKAWKKYEKSMFLGFAFFLILF